MWEDLPTDVNALADPDEMDAMLESFYDADLSNELAPDAAGRNVSSERVEANDVFNLADPFFDVTQPTVVLPEQPDVSLQPISREGPAYNAGAMVAALMK